jgi:Ca-activated chloride channel family protein
MRIFSTDLSTTEPMDYVDLAPVEPIGGQREALAAAIQNLVPIAGTPLYTTTGDSYRDLVETFEPDKINAVVLLSDGVNDDPRNSDLEGLLAELQAGTEGGSATPVRIFPISYSVDADLGVLRRIAEATNAAVYDATDPRSIDRVLTAVISNF